MKDRLSFEQELRALGLDARRDRKVGSMHSVKAEEMAQPLDLIRAAKSSLRPYTRLEELRKSCAAHVQNRGSEAEADLHSCGRGVATRC